MCLCVPPDEYYALWQLVIIVPTYYCVFVGFGWIVMGAYMAGASDANSIIDKNDNNAAWYLAQRAPLIAMTV
jgi:hypothetical protein